MAADSKKQDAINALTAHMDREDPRYQKTVDYLNCRARPGQVKTVEIAHKTDGMDRGLDPSGKTTLTAGKCPCSICGHEFMWECHEADCYCCSSACT